MTKYYSEILKIKNWQLKSLISDLENKTNKPKHDLKLYSDIKKELFFKIKELGLDPFDSDSLEIYHALNSKLEQLDKKLIKYLRTKSAHYINLEANLSDGLFLFLNDLTSGLKVLSVKKVFFKKYLLANPPKATLRALKYRSIDSLIKREPIELILISLNRVESVSYLDKFYNHLKNLKITDFEERPVNFLKPSARYQEITSAIKSILKKDFILSLESASVVIPDISNQPTKGLTIKLLIEILNDILLLQSISTYLKLSEFRKDFSLRAFEVFEHEPSVNSNLHQFQLPFSLVHKLANQYSQDLKFDFPLKEDFKLLNFKELLPHIISDFKFFSNSDHLFFYKDNKSVSFNILDIANNLVNLNEFENRSSNHLKSALHNELFGRYLSKDHLEAILEEESS